MAGMRAVVSDEDDGVRITVDGHSSEAFGETERDQVCAAVSMLLMTLASVTEGAEWLGEGSGYVSCYVPKANLVLAEFVVAGLQLVEASYPEHLVLVRTDTRLYKSPETARWNRATLPAPTPKISIPE